VKRLFIAVDIDEATRAQVGRISSGLRAAIETQTKASWVRPERMHLTLRFLGDVEDTLEQRVRRTLVDPIPVAPFDVTFDGLGFFPERGSPRVLWLGVAAGLEPLRCLHAVFVGLGASVELDAPVGLGTSVGLDLSRALPKRTTESFTPHLTLARFRDRAPRGALAGITRIPASAGPARIDRVTLYESRLSPKGSTYIPVAEAPLQL
jgi:RNA 2',3'-cyclic 3'-phosphodiesterase